MLEDEFAHLDVNPDPLDVAIGELFLELQRRCEVEIPGRYRVCEDQPRVYVGKLRIECDAVVDDDNCIFKFMHVGHLNQGSDFLTSSIKQVLEYVQL